MRAGNGTHVNEVPATAHAANFSILAVEIPGQAPVNAGVLLQDPRTDRLYVRMRRDWDALAPAEAEVLSALESDLAAKAAELGAAQLMGLIEDWLSNTVRVSVREPVEVEDFERSLGRLYREHVRSNVLEFVTHLPRYSLAVAAGKPRVEVADLLGVSLTQLGEWLRVFRNQGLEALCTLHHHGDPGKLTARQVEQLQDEIRSGRFRNSDQIRQWLEETFGVRYTSSGVKQLLKRIGAS